MSRLALLAEMVRAEDSFFRYAFRSSAPVANVAAYILLRQRFYELVTTVLREEDEQTIATGVHIHFPAGWGEPVAVRATQEQIDNVLVPIPADREMTSCAICQESVVREEGVQLQACLHQFHSTCIREWFTQSVRCPVCRNDIRGNDMEEL
jgi:hypothetical protein